jgi:hypothetical protein
VGLALFASLVSLTQGQTSHLTAREAKDHVGENATVCGKVVSARFAKDSKGQPTFLNLDEPYPNQVFTIVVWGSNREKFGDIEAKYKVKNVCATGKITAFKGVPEIEINDPNQIEIQKQN